MVHREGILKEFVTEWVILEHMLRPQFCLNSCDLWEIEEVLLFNGFQLKCNLIVQEVKIRTDMI
jgi:hypothetical protein